MKAKDYVSSFLPKVKEEKHLKNNKKSYWIIRNGRQTMPMSSGETKKEAWDNAREKLLMKKYSITLENINSHENGFDISNNAEVLGYINEAIEMSIKKEELSLFSNLTKEFTYHFGKPNETVKLEFNTKIWYVKFNDISINILTSKRGTSYEIKNVNFQDLREDKYNEVILEFLCNMYKLINY